MLRKHVQHFGTGERSISAFGGITSSARSPSRSPFGSWLGRPGWGASWFQITRKGLGCVMRKLGVSGGLAVVILMASGTATEAFDVHPGLPAAAPNASGKPKLAAVTLRATIDLARQRLTVTSNGKRLYRWPISSGRLGFETPPGRFKPSWMARQWYSRKYDMAPMPYAVFFNQGIATHGTSAVSRLGRPASHGCIRLHTANARRFYHLVRRHGKAATQIIVTGRVKQRRYSSRRTRRSYGASRNRVRYSLGAYNRVARPRPVRRSTRRISHRRSIYQGYR